MTDTSEGIHGGGRSGDEEVVRSAQGRALVFDETQLTYIRIDHQTRLRFGEVEVVIECPFVLTVDDAIHRLDPGARLGLAPLLALYPDSLSSAYVSERGELRLDFDSGATVVVPPDADHEAWQVHDGHGRLLICMPEMSGDTAEWLRP